MSGGVVIFNVFGHLNTGDAMLVEAAYDVLTEHVAPEELAGIAFDVQSERKWMAEIEWHERLGNRVGEGFFGKIRQALSIMIVASIALSPVFLPLHKLLPPNQRSAIKALRSARVAISCPGGYLEDSNFSYIINLLQMLVARRLCSRVILAPQSIGPITSRLGRKFLAFTLQRMDIIYAREQPSIDFLRNELALDDLDIRSSGDVAFWHTRRRSRELEAEWQRLGIDPGKPILGITVVSWNFPGHPDSTAAQEAYLVALEALVKKANLDGSYQIVVFNQVSFDLPVADQLAARCPNIIIDRFERDAALLASMISQCEIFIGSRFHSCIFSLLGNVPTLAIAYLPKTEGIMADLGLGSYSLPIATIRAETLLKKYDELVESKGAISRLLTDRVPLYREERGQFISDIPTWIGGPSQ